MVPAGVRQGREHVPGTDCNKSPKNSETGCAGMAAEAGAGYAAYSWNLVDSTSRGKCGSCFLTTHRRRIPATNQCLRTGTFVPRLAIDDEWLSVEMKLVISQILSNFELTITSNRPVRLGRRGVTSGPSPFRMIITRRFPEFPSYVAPDSSLVA